MKIHEIDWVEDKRYKVTIDKWHKVEVVVRGLNLRINDSGEKGSLTNIFNIKSIIDADFEEIVQPTTFLEAYQDCLDNGVDYVSTCGVFKLQKLSGDVQLRFTRGCHDMVGLVLDKIEWVKVSK